MADAPLNFSKTSISNAKLLQRDVIDAKLHSGYDPELEQNDRRNILGLDNQQDNKNLKDISGAQNFPLGISNTSDDSPSNLVQTFKQGGNGNSFLPGIDNANNGNPLSNGEGNGAALGSNGNSALENAAFNGDGGSGLAARDAGVGRNSSAFVSVHSGEGDPTPQPPPSTPDPQPSPGLDAPDVSAGNGTGSENTPVLLPIGLVSDPDAASTVVIISNVPINATLSAGINNGNGTWTLTPAQLLALTITPPPYFSGVLNLGVTAVSTGNGQTLTDMTTLNVTITGVATTPLLTTSSASGLEDTAISLNISAALIDQDGSETLSLLIANVPSGATLSAGIDNGNGTWSLTPAQLTGLTLTPPLNYSGQINLSVTATSAENGTTASTQNPLIVMVGGVADTPLLNTSPASGAEDTTIPLVINASLTDTDGSETLTITISNVPAGSIFSAGTDNGNGTWTLASADLAGLTFTPAQHLSGVISLNITATASENGTSSSSSSILNVAVTGSATPPFLATSPASGLEDAAIPLSISANLNDTDGSETLTVTISNVPTGAMLSAGVNNGGGIWTLTPAQLTNLTLTPPLNFSGSIALLVTATATEGSSSSVVSTPLQINVEGVADVPTLSVMPASGNEDTAIPLTITSALTDLDGSETLSITIAGMPAGASLSAGIDNGNGTWTLTPAQLTGLTLTPPLHSSGTINLSVTATASENGTSASSTGTFAVNILPVGTPPTLSTSPASGNEDTAIALSISAALVDITETLSITIGNVPAGSTLPAGIDNGNGTWSLTPAEIVGLTLTPPLNYSGLISLSVTATSTDGINSSNIVSTLPVTVSGIADLPTLSVSPASGAEDTAIALNIISALTDTDGSETLSVTIANVPAGASFSAGINNGNGSWTFTSAQLTGLTFTPPLHSSGVISLSVTATASESGTTATTSAATLNVSVSGTATAPTLTTPPASGNEDTALPLAINAALVDTDGSEVLGITITGVPAGATLSAGINNGGGNWSLTPAQLTGLTLTPPLHFSGAFALTVIATTTENATTATTQTTLPVTIVGVADTPLLSVQAASGTEDTAIALTITSALVDTDGSESLSVLISNVPIGATLSAGLYKGSGQWSLTASELTGLTLIPPHNYSGPIALIVTAISTETNGNDTTISVPLNVTIAGAVDTPQLSVQNVIGYEDTAIALNVSANLVDTDGSETLSITISGVPAGASLSAGTNNGNGTWTLSAAQLNNLTITPPAHSNADFTLGISVTSTEFGGATSTVNSSLSVNVIGVADLPTASASNAVGASGVAIPLIISGALSDTDGSETLTFMIHGMPDGFALNKGLNNGDNTWTLTPAQLTGLSLISPHHFDGQLNLHVRAISHENDGDIQVSAPTAFNVRIGDYSHGYLVDLGVGVGVGGIGAGVHVGALPDIDLFPAAGGILGLNGMDVKEDTPYLIADAPGLLARPALSAVLGLIATIQFSGIPSGVTFSSGTNLGGGVWRFTTAQLNNLYMTAPPNSDVDFNIGVHANLLFGLADVFVLSNPVHVMGIADLPTLSVSAGTGTEDTALALNISGALTDTDGSESLSFLVSGMPAGFSLNHGIDNGNGTWSLNSSQLAGLMIVPARDYSGVVNITVSAVATEREGDQAVRQQTLGITFNPAIDTPHLAPVAANGFEDQPITLNFGITLGDIDGSEHVTALVISGLPAGASLLGATNNGNGTWNADINHLDQVQLVPPSNWSGDVSLNLSLTVREGSSGPQTTVASSLAVHINAVADTPLATAGDVTGESNHAIGLNLSAALTDTDGSEALSVVISGIPNDFMLNHGLNNGDGSWTLHGNDLSTLNMVSSDNFTGDVNLTMTVFAIEANGHVASTQQDFTVHVTPDI